MSKWLVALALVCTFAPAGHAQVARQLPANGRLGELIGSPAQAFPVIRIGGELMRLAPGGVIFDEHNRTIVHGAIPERAVVLYVVAEVSGEVTRIYILRPEEIELLRRTLAR